MYVTAVALNQSEAKINGNTCAINKGCRDITAGSRSTLGRLNNFRLNISYAVEMTVFIDVAYAVCRKGIHSEDRWLE